MPWATESREGEEKMIIKNAKVFMDTSGCFEHLDILVRDGKIAEIAEVLDAEEEAVIDA